MKKSMIFSMMALLGILLISNCVSATVFSAGDRVPVRYPESGYGTAVFEKPKFVRYTMFDTVGTVIYEEDHPVTYRHEELFGLGWTWYDEYAIRLPSFPVEGTWKISGRLFSELLWIIEDPSLFPYDKEFEVGPSELFDNLVAPWYITFDMGPIVGRWSFVSPVSLQLILIFAALIVVIIILIRRIGRAGTTPVILKVSK